LPAEERFEVQALLCYENVEDVIAVEIFYSQLARSLRRGSRTGCDIKASPLVIDQNNAFLRACVRSIGKNRSNCDQVVKAVATYIGGIRREVGDWRDVEGFNFDLS
jgi:hypothetical protein